MTGCSCQSYQAPRSYLATVHCKYPGRYKGPVVLTAQSAHHVGAHAVDPQSPSSPPRLVTAHFAIEKQLHRRTPDHEHRYTRLLLNNSNHGRPQPRLHSTHQPRRRLTGPHPRADLEGYVQQAVGTPAALPTTSVSRRRLTHPPSAGLQIKIRQAQKFVPVIESTDVLEDSAGTVTRVAHFKATESGPAHEVKEVCKEFAPCRGEPARCNPCVLLSRGGCS